MKEFGLDLGLLVSQIVNFGILVALLYVLLYKPIANKLDERAAKIKKGLEDAEHAARLDADSGLHYEEEMERARREAREIIERATRAAEQQRREILSQAREEAHSLIVRAQQQAQREIQEGKIALRQQVVNLSIDAASRLIQREIDEDTHHQLIEQFLSEADEL